MFQFSLLQFIILITIRVCLQVATCNVALNFRHLALINPSFIQLLTGLTTRVIIEIVNETLYNRRILDDYYQRITSSQGHITNAAGAACGIVPAGYLAYGNRQAGTAGIFPHGVPGARGFTGCNNGREFTFCRFVSRKKEKALSIMLKAALRLGRLRGFHQTRLTIGPLFGGIMSYFDYNSQYQLRDLWYREKVDTIPYKNMSWNTKGVIRGITNMLIRKQIPFPYLEPTPVWYPRIAELCGFSEKGKDGKPKENRTFHSEIERLDIAGAIVRDTAPITNSSTGVTKTHTRLAFTSQFMEDPLSLFAQKKKDKRGGDTTTKRHKGCGGEIANSCTRCGKEHIPDSEIYETQNAEPGHGASKSQEEHQQLLSQLDSHIESLDRFYEAADIDDDVCDAMGGVQKALAASPSEIASVMSLPRYVREGLTEEDEARVAEELASLNAQYKGGMW